MSSWLSGANFTDTPGWRVGLLFLIFLFITFAYEWLTRLVHRALRTTNKRALRHVVRQLEKEIAALGVVSLLLSVFTGQFVQLCLTCDAEDPDCFNLSAAGVETQSILVESNVTVNVVRDTAEVLFAELETTLGGGNFTEPQWEGVVSSLFGSLLEKAGENVAVACPPGTANFWSPEVIHQAHLFLFSIAVTHLLYAVITLLLTQWRINWWADWERRVVTGTVEMNTGARIPQLGSNIVTRRFRSYFLQFYHNGVVTEAVYIGLRRLFIERLRLDEGFNFMVYMSESSQEEFSQIIGLDFILWLIVTVWISLPDTILYGFIAMTAISATLSFVLGAKLVRIVTRLAYLAYAYDHEVDENYKHSSLWTTVKLKNAYSDHNPDVAELRKTSSHDQDSSAGHSTHHDSAHGATNGSNKALSALVVEVPNGAAEEENKKGNSLCGKEPGSPGEPHHSTPPVAPEAAHLFWFSNPRLMLRGFQYAYFQTSLIIAWVWFSAWQDLGYINGILGGWPITLLIMLINVGLLLHQSLVWLPLYSLIISTGCQPNLAMLKYAAELDIQTRLRRTKGRLGGRRGGLSRSGSDEPQSFRSTLREAAAEKFNTAFHTIAGLADHVPGPGLFGRGKDSGEAARPAGAVPSTVSESDGDLSMVVGGGDGLVGDQAPGWMAPLMQHYNKGSSNTHGVAKLMRLTTLQAARTKDAGL